MKLNKNIILLILGFATLLYPSAIIASEVTNNVKSTVDEILKILKDETLKGPEKAEERRAKLKKIISERFDFEEMAKRSLGRHWRKRSDAEKKEFVNLFSEFLEASYIDKIEGYTNEEVVYLGEKKNKNRSVVKSKIVTSQGREIPVSYRLLKKDGWMVYDIVIEGVSLVRNYRTQFNDVISRSSYGELVKRLKAKLEGL